ncbi:MAG TPA: sulfatase-like hydrolase/transferase [Thermoanaerobaculia bacterium]|nr:sulfatase-like hydrolase/transferase [Thermoanaerobaculia bacterium]
MSLRRFLAFALLCGGVVLACRGRRTAPAARSAGGPIILISVDTLRSDHLPAYGYRGVETPWIDRLRRDGVLFEDVWSQCPLTLPSHVSILTGLAPPAHGVRNNIGYRLDARAHPTLARFLKDKGYATGASVSAWVLRGETGLANVFDFYDDAIEPPPASKAASQARRPGSDTVARAIAWTEKVRDRPFFLFLHLYEPHAPYEPPEPFRSRFALPYDGAIAAADAAVGTLLERLIAWKLYDRATIVFLSDHGEGLLDHGEQEHGILLYREALAVPLIVKLPGALRAGERVRGPAALTDVFPTLAALAGGALPAGVSGRDLLGASGGAVAPVYSETFYPRIHLGWSELRSLADARRHFIDGPEPELYDRKDMAEKTNVFSAEASSARDLKRELNRIPSDFQVPAAADAEQVKKLTALGYLSATSPSVTGGSLPSPMRMLPLLEEARRAFELEASGDRPGAIAAFRAILAKDPNYFDVQYKLGQTLEAQGRLEDAASAYRQAILVSPAMAAGAALALAKVSLRLGDLDAAQANAQVALPEGPGDAHEILARVALARVELAQAEREAAAVSGTPSLQVRQAVLIAEIRLRQNQPAEALQILDGALSAAPPGVPEQIGNAQFLRGDALARLNRFGEAETAFQEEIRLFPKNTDAYARLAVLYGVERRRVADVYGLLERMYKASPSPETASLAAKTLESMGDPAGASAWRRRAASAAGERANGQRAGSPR